MTLPPENTQNSFVAVLLAGGRSRRMGRDKAMLQLDGRPLWRYQLDTLLSLRPARTLIASRPDQTFPSLPAGVNVIADASDGAGALAALPALLSGPLPQLPRLVTAVDMPGIGAPFLQRNFLATSGATGIVLVDDQKRIQPIPCLLAPGCLALAHDLLATDELSLQAFCRACIAAGAMRAVPASPEDAPQLTSVNSPEDWESFNEAR